MLNETLNIALLPHQCLNWPSLSIQKIDKLGSLAACVAILGLRLINTAGGSNMTEKACGSTAVQSIIKQ